MVEVKVRAVAQSWIEGTRLQARTVIGERVSPVQWQAPAAGVERLRYGCACGRPGEGSRRIDLVEDGGRCPGIRLCNAHTRMHGVRESCFLGPRRESPLQLRISSWRRGAVAPWRVVADCTGARIARAAATRYFASIYALSCPRCPNGRCSGIRRTSHSSRIHRG